jgi:hypothetical protein
MGLREAILENKSVSVSKALKTEGVTEELLLLVLNNRASIPVIMILIKKATFIQGNTVCLQAAVEHQAWTACHQLIAAGALVTEACLQRAREVDAPEDTLDKLIQAPRLKPVVELSQAAPAEEAQLLLANAGFNAEADVRAVIQSTHPRAMAKIRITLGRLMLAPTDKKALEQTLGAIRGIPGDLNVIDVQGINFDVLDNTVVYQILKAFPKHVSVLGAGSQADVGAAQKVTPTQEAQANLDVTNTNFIPVGTQGIAQKKTKERQVNITVPARNAEALARVFYEAIEAAPAARRRPENQLFIEQLRVVKDITLENFTAEKAGFSFDECRLLARAVKVLSSKVSKGLNQKDVDAFAQAIEPYTTCSRMKAALAGLIGAALGLVAGFALGGVPGAAIGAVAGFGLFSGGYAYQYHKNHPLTQVADTAKTVIATP